ncbi:hypothetical protein CBM2599_A120546 [Cupriavidus taiwanensis]|nr:hypothetical protein CBM2599_A120546 [Cupriavidus taiwanensis]SOY81949.1 hypothetical protein CBM2600_A120567 [Cupriavidus taiwanensis]
MIAVTAEHWESTMESLTLTKEEIIEATGYKRGADCAPKE